MNMKGIIEMMEKQVVDETKESKENVHLCNICGKETEWDDAIWINSSFGVCENCINIIPDEIRDNIEEEHYDNITTYWLLSRGASF